MNRIVVAIDGFSSCGKSTLAKALAHKLGYRFIDSGAMYRSVSLYFMNHFIQHDDKEAVNHALKNIHIEFKINPATKIQETFLNGENVESLIRNMKVSNNVSRVSTILEVRRALVKQQQYLGKDKGIVMDGRDIGTAVFPDAEVKLFMTADPKIRAQRRLAELMQKGEIATFDQVYKNLLERDHIDTTRQEIPLRQAEDAIVIDNTWLTTDEQFNKALEIVQDAIAEIENRKPGFHF